MSGKCPICEETDPRPASLCLARLTGCAESGKPCQYSVEGQARTREAMLEQSARVLAEVEADRAQRGPAKSHPRGGQADG